MSVVGSSILTITINGVSVPVFNTLEAPLFDLSALANAIGDKNYRRAAKKCENKKIDGKKYLTENGAYKYLMQSNCDPADEFRNRVAAMLVKLRMEGKLELEHRATTAETRANNLAILLESCRIEINSRTERMHLMEQGCHLKYHYDKSDHDASYITNFHIGAFIYNHKYGKCGCERRLHNNMEIGHVSDIVRKTIKTDAALCVQNREVDDMFIDLVHKQMSVYLV